LTDARDDEDQTLPRARALRRRWPGLVWAIPLAALIIVAYLGIRALSRQGVDVVVQFGYAEGVTPGDTKVLENGVEIGRVSKVRVSKDGRHVDVTLRLDPRAKKALNTRTTFWLIGENPTITDIQSIRAAVAGVIIAMAPGTGGAPTREFHGLDSPPIIPPGAKGSIYYFKAAKLGSIQQGAAINFRGLAIGKVVKTSLLRPDAFRIEAFVNAPYDRLVTPDAQFWTGSPLKLSLTGASLSAGLASPASVLQGAIEFDRPENGGKGPQAPANTVFPLYDDQSSARQGPAGPSVPYRLVLKGVAGDLAIDSDIKMLGYTVGRVTSAKLVFAPGGRPYTEAGIALYPRKFDVELPRGTAEAAWRGATDRAVERLLAQGYRAHMVQSPPFVGAHVVTLAADKGAGPARLGMTGAVPLLPVAESEGTADDLMDKADAILTKVNQIPFAEIGANMRKITASLASPQVQDSINHLNGTLRQLDQIMTEVKPQIGPMMAKLNQTADELHGTAKAARTVLSGEGAAQDRSLPDAIQQLDGAARSIRALTDYLGRHPEALLKGKAKEKK
jgi:paraquat-inducible protein B